MLGLGRPVHLSMPTEQTSAQHHCKKQIAFDSPGDEGEVVCVSRRVSQLSPGWSALIAHPNEWAEILIVSIRQESSARVGLVSAEHLAFAVVKALFTLMAA